MGGPQHNVAFPRKLYDLIEAEPDHLIEWAPAGEAFFIRDQDEFCSQVLAKYFRHTKLTSFQRQLNLYGFRRITKGLLTGAYSHPLFSRDNPVHVDTIKRVVRKGGDERGPPRRWTHHHGHHKHQSPPGGTGASPNSPHSFPDDGSMGSSRSRTSTRTRGQSWAHLNDDDDVEDDAEDEEDAVDDDYEDEEEYQPAGRRRRPGNGNGNAYSKTYMTHSGGRGGRTRAGASGAVGDSSQVDGGLDGGAGTEMNSGIAMPSATSMSTGDHDPGSTVPSQLSLSRSAPAAGFITTGFGHGGKGIMLRQDQAPQPGEEMNSSDVDKSTPATAASTQALAMPPPLARISSNSSAYGGGLSSPPASGLMSPAHSFPPPGAAGSYFFGRSASSESACQMTDEAQSSTYPHQQFSQQQQEPYPLYQQQQYPQHQPAQAPPQHQPNQAGAGAASGSLGSLGVPTLGRATSDTFSLAGSEQWQIDDRMLAGMGNAMGSNGAGGGDSLLDLTALAGLESGGTFDDLEAFNFESSFSDATYGSAPNGGGGASSLVMGSGPNAGQSGGSPAVIGACNGAQVGGSSAEGADQGQSSEVYDGGAFQMDMDSTG